MNSDGMNYNAGYANGKSVSKIALSTFTEEKKIAVGMNPTKIAADASGNVLRCVWVITVLFPLHFGR